MTMSKQWINVVVVGCGRIYNDAHRDAYVNKFSTNNVVIGLCDIRKELVDNQFKWLTKKYKRLLKRAKKKDNVDEIERVKFGLDNLEKFTSYDKMLDALEGEVELVDNCTPGRLHIPLAVQAMEHGINAMAEKPPGMNFLDVQRVVEAEEKTGKCFQLNENICYERPTQKMREVINSGKLGKVTEIEIHFGHGGPYVPHHFGESGLPHFIDPLWSGGGCLQDLAPHGISRAFWPIGKGSKIIDCKTKVLERRKNPRVMSGKPFESPVDDWAEAELTLHDPRTNSDYTMLVTTSWCGGFSFPFSIEGETGFLSVASNPDTKQYDPIIYYDEDEEFFPIDDDQWDPHSGYAREIQIYCNNLLDGKPSETPGTYALRLQEILSMHYFSKLKGETVTLEQMNDWGKEIKAKHDDIQDAVDEVATTFASVVDLK